MKAYLAVIDRSGLRAFLPEDDAGLRRAGRLCARLTDARCCWAVVPDEAVPVLEDLLDGDERRAALAVLGSDAVHSGPVLAKPHDSFLVRH